MFLFGCHKDAKTLDTMLPENIFGGVGVSDDAAVYRRRFSWAQKCWAHLLRKAIRLAMLYPRKKRYQRFLDSLLTLYYDAKRAAADGRLGRQARERKVAEFEGRLSDLCRPHWRQPTPGRPPHERDFANLANELTERLFDEELFTFVLRPEVDPTNNVAERLQRSPAKDRDAGAHQQDGSRSTSPERHHQRVGVVAGKPRAVHAAQRGRGGHSLDAGRDQFIPAATASDHPFAARAGKHKLSGPNNVAVLLPSFPALPPCSDLRPNPSTHRHHTASRHSVLRGRGQNGRAHKYPQAEFPYARLVEENRRRSRRDPEFELLDTGIFDDHRYFDLFVEYAKSSPNDILIRVTAANRGPEGATLHLLPTVWFRNTWSWGCLHEACTVKPRLWQFGEGAVRCEHPTLGRFHFRAGADLGGRAPTLLFTDNHTNYERLYQAPNESRYVKDAFHDYVVRGRSDAVNPGGNRHEGRSPLRAEHRRARFHDGPVAAVRRRRGPGGTVWGGL